MSLIAGRDKSSGDHQGELVYTFVEMALTCRSVCKWQVWPKSVLMNRLGRLLELRVVTQCREARFTLSSR